jgi:hypothetical protein
MYDIVRSSGSHLVVKDGAPLLTVMGRPVQTTHVPLARRLVKDLSTYGEDPTDPVSLVAFHYAMIDFFLVMPRAELEHLVAIGLDCENDWTFQCPTAAPEPMMDWMGLFGTHSTRAEAGKKWLSSLTLTQLCAVCVLGRGLESVNIPFMLATMLAPEEVSRFAKAINGYYPYVGVKNLTKFFRNFLFYYGLDTAQAGESRGPQRRRQRVRVATGAGRRGVVKGGD